MSCPYTPADLDELRRLFTSGVKRVTYNGRTVEYRDLAEIERALAAVESCQAADAGESVIRQVRTTTRSGFES